MRDCLTSALLAAPPEAGDDTALVAAAQADRTAFGAIYDRYFGRVYAYLHARTGSENDAADLTQQVFLQALDAIGRFQDRRLPLAAWPFRIARNSLSLAFTGTGKIWLANVSFTVVGQTTGAGGKS